MSSDWYQPQISTQAINEPSEKALREYLSSLFRGLFYSDMVQVVNESLGNVIDRCPISDTHVKGTRTFTHSNGEWVGSDSMCELVLEEALKACMHLNLELNQEDPTRMYNESGEVCTKVLEYFIRISMECPYMSMNLSYDDFIKDMNEEQYCLFEEVCNAYEDGYIWK